MRLALLALLPLLAAASRDRVPPATPAGPPVSCLRLADIRESLVRDDRTIDFVTNGGRRVYRVELTQGCPMLGFEKRFSYATSLDRLCSTDIITVLTETGGDLSRGASCGMAPFQPVTLTTAGAR